MVSYCCRAGLFDNGLDEDERKAIATKLLNCHHPNMFHPGKQTFPTELMVVAPKLD